MYSKYHMHIYSCTSYRSGMMVQDVYVMYDVQYMYICMYTALLMVCIQHTCGTIHTCTVLYVCNKILFSYQANHCFWVFTTTRRKVRTALFSILYLFYIKNTSYLQYSYRLKKSLNVLKQWSVPGMLYYIY